METLTPTTDGVLDVVKAARARGAPLDEPIRWSLATRPIGPERTIALSVYGESRSLNRCVGSIEAAIAWVNGGSDEELRVVTALCLLGVWHVAHSHEGTSDGNTLTVGDKITATFTPCPFSDDDEPDDDPCRMPGWRSRKENASGT